MIIQVVKLLKIYPFKFLFKKGIDHLLKHGVFSLINFIKISAALNQKKISIPLGLLSKEKFKKNILIVGVTGLQQCYRYRIIQKAEMLKLAGWQVLVADYSDRLRWIEYLHLVKCVIVYRVHECGELNELIDQCKKRRLKIIYDIDDPIFDDTSVQSNPNLKFLEKNIRQSIKNDIKIYKDAIIKFDSFCVSTTHLKELILKYKPNSSVLVLQNIMEGELCNHRAVHRKKYRLCLASGSKSVQADMLILKNQINKLINSSSDIELTIIGEISDEIDFECSNIYPLTDYNKYIQILSNCDVLLVPLKMCEFNMSKSYARFLDATLAGIPVIASPVGEYKKLSECGFILSSGDYEWADAVLQLKNDELKAKKLVELSRLHYSRRIQLPEKQELIERFINDVA